MNKTNVYEDDDGKYDKIIDFLEEKERKEAKQELEKEQQACFFVFVLA